MAAAAAEVATGLVDLCKAGKFSEAIDKYYSDDIVSVEPMGPEPESKGIAAIRAKTEWWVNAHEVHSMGVDGPFVNGDQFGVIFHMDVTNKESGQRMTGDEIGIYTVEGDKIIHERFFFGKG